MSELDKSYNPKSTENKWLEFWQTNKLFELSDEQAQKADFKIALPPPNVTGELHMGHALNLTLQDILIRYKQMSGQKAHWQVGCDHAGIGTQILVEKQLAKKGLNKYDIGRDELIKQIWAWTDEHKGKIEAQMKLLGISADFSKSRFTLDENYTLAVRKAFFELFEQGLIYQGKRLINWCPNCLTSLSDLEVVHEDRNAKLYEIKYILVESLENIQELIVATSRPETLFGDVAVAINPADERYKVLSDKIKNGENIKAKLPLTDREIPIILSEEVKIDFGTGALKITPAHDFNDQEIIKQQSSPIEAINIFNEKAELLKLNFIPVELHGLDRFKAREKVLALLTEKELLVAEKKYKQAAALHDRCGTIIEPFLSEQWFVQMKPLAKLAINAVKENKIKFHPERYTKTYLDWLENIQDWCISRQLWWGHQIPVWTKKFNNNQNPNNPIEAEELHSVLANEFKKIAHQANYNTSLTSDKKHSSFVIANKPNNKLIFQYAENGVQIITLQSDPELEELLKQANYVQDPDVLDTWFSSALWPFATLNWPKQAQPANNQAWTNVLSTAREIINLWVSRMIFSSINLTESLPFTDILIHPVLQTPDGKRMSKSKGNAIDPIELVNKYGADASRLWYCSVGIFGNQDIRFPGLKEKDGTWSSGEIEQKRRFINKLWNATKFVLQTVETVQNKKTDQKTIAELIRELNLEKNIADIWILGEWNKTLEEINQHLNNYEFSEFVQKLENFVWNDFCDWYLEIIKISSSSSQESNFQSNQILFYILSEVLKALSPVIPFASDELYSILTNTNNSLINTSYPKAEELSVESKEKINQAKNIIESGKFKKNLINSFRQKTLGLSPKEIFNTTTTNNTNYDFPAYFSLLFNTKEVTESDLGNKKVKLIINKNHSVLVQIPESVNLAERKEILEKDLNKKVLEKQKLEIRFNDSGFFNNATEEVKQTMRKNLDILNLEINELNKSIQQISEI